MTAVLIILAAWLLIVLLVLAICRMAARGDGREDRPRRRR